jgi:anti-anti-sigma factor
MDLKVDSTSDGQVLTLVGRGEIDYATLDVLENELDKATDSEAETVVVDLQDVTYIDSAGLGVLVKAHRRMTSENRALVLRVTSPDIIKLFDITGLAHLFAVEMPYDADGPEGTGSGS